MNCPRTLLGVAAGVLILVLLSLGFALGDFIIPDWMVGQEWMP